jgi:hypothetical protein
MVKRKGGKLIKRPHSRIDTGVYILIAGNFQAAHNAAAERKRCGQKKDLLNHVRSAGLNSLKPV